MKETSLLTEETSNASQEGALAIELFLMSNYRFRRNILNGKVEYANLTKAEDAEATPVESDYKPLSPTVLNSIVIRTGSENFLICIVRLLLRTNRKI